MCPHIEPMKTKGGKKGSEKSTKCNPSYFEYVDAFHSVHDSAPTPPISQIISPRNTSPRPFKNISLLD
jgi:hypothetical protein